MRQVSGESAEVALRLRGEGGIEALIELLKRQPPVRVMFPQLGGYSLAFSVPDAQAWLRCHLPLHAVRRLMAKRYIATSWVATGGGAWWA